MKECTLQEAVIECHKSGGEYWLKSRPEQRFSLDDMGQPVHSPEGMPAMFYAERYSETWIYEPSQSAFQEWSKSMPYNAKISIGDKHICTMGTSDTEQCRKEGWNAALDAVIEEILGSSERTDIKEYFIDHIEKLKEP